MSTQWVLADVKENLVLGKYDSEEKANEALDGLLFVERKKIFEKYKKDVDKLYDRYCVGEVTSKEDEH